MTRQVLLAGEGPNELGGWGRHSSYQSRRPDTGALEALLRKVAPEGWQIRAGVIWKDLRFYRATDRLPKDELNTRALWLIAHERGCDLIVFSRDRDGLERREQDVKRGREWLDAKAQDSGWAVVGEVAAQCLEAWVLALQGRRRSEQLGRNRACEDLRVQNIVETPQLVACIEGADFQYLPEDARTLRSWLDQARTASQTNDDPIVA